jgi:hypothetical protein
LILTIFIFSSPSRQTINKVFSAKPWKVFFGQTFVTAKNYSTNNVGGQDAIDFINQNIPAKSVFNATGGFFYLPTVVDVHMTSYSSSADTNYSMIYDGKDKITDNRRLSIINVIEADYLLVHRSKAKTEEIELILDQYPDYLQKVFKNKAVIYKINKKILNEDLKSGKIKS